MATTVSQPGYYNLQALTTLGALGAGYRLYTYVTGTTTHKNAYTEATGTTVQTYTSDGVGGQYIALDARGELSSPLYLTTGAYDLCLKTAAGATVWTRRADPVMDADVDLTSVTGVLPVANGGSGAATSAAAPWALKGANSDITRLDVVNALAPATVLPTGAAGENAMRVTTVRASGFNSYGAVLSRYRVTDSIPSGEYDFALTAWANGENLTGGSIFGGWAGANGPSAALGQTYTSGSVVGWEINAGNRWANFGLQTDVGGTRYTVGLQNVPDVVPAPDGVNTTNITSISIGASATVTWPSTHGFYAGMGIVFGGSGTMPGGITAGTPYYILASGLTATEFQFSTSLGGTAVTTTGSFVAPITGLPSWPGSFAEVQGASVHGHQWWVGSLIRYNTIAPGGHGHLAHGGSVAAGRPLDWASLDGFWTNGVDFSGGDFSGACLVFGSGQVSGSATNGSGEAMKANVQGYINITVAGTARRIPYVAA